jgi:endonuclease-3
MKAPSISDTDLEEKRHIIRHVIEHLEAAYGVPVNDSTDDPLDELILTILSQSTTHLNSQRAFQSLKQRFTDCEAVRRARPVTIAEAIRSGRLARVKSVVIKNVLNEIRNRRGTLDLSFLRTTSVAEAREFLSSLKGVGPKTVGCVLLFACALPIFPMDTHIFRIARRMGLIPPKGSDAQAHSLMESLIPEVKHYSLHINLIRHGRKVCHPQNPRCETCCLIEYCSFGQSLT